MLQESLAGALDAILLEVYADQDLVAQEAGLETVVEAHQVGLTVVGRRRDDEADCTGRAEHLPGIIQMAFLITTCVPAGRVRLGDVRGRL